MKLRLKTVLILVAIALAGTGLLAYRLRHRFRAMFEAQKAESARQSLQVSRSERSLAAPPAVAVSEGDWPWWRGVHHDNRATGIAPPLTWSESENIRWKTPLAGRGHSSPCLLGNRIFLTQASDAKQIQEAVCLNAQTGNIEWSKAIHQGGFIYSNSIGSHASSTAATDGHLVFVVFATNNSIWLTALSLDGEIAWQREAGPYASKEGFGASPAIVGDYVIVAADSVNQSWIGAWHRQQGELVWRVPRGPGTSYASPIVFRDDGRALIAIAGLNRVAAIDPSTGQEVWKTDGPDLSASTPVVGDGMLFASGCTKESGWIGMQLPNYAETDRGDAPRNLWKLPMKSEIPSPIYSTGRVYFVQDIGIAHCLDAVSGKELWKKRLGSNAIASPVLHDGHLFVSLENGHTIVLRDDSKYEQVADNSLDAEGVYATPTISSGRIFLRSTTHLYCISEDATPSPEKAAGK